MKKLTVFALLGAMIFVPFICAFAQSAEQLLAQIVNFRVFVDGSEQKFDLPIVTINDRTYIPVREVLEKMGLNISWNDDEMTIIIDNPANDGSDLYKFQKDGLYGFMDKNGNVIVQPKYDRADDFSEGLAGITIGNSFGYINIHGEIVVPLVFSWGSPSWP